MLIVLNNKCHFSKKEYIKYLAELKKINPRTNQIIICPPMAYLSLTNPNHFKIGSQNVSKNSYGSYTGEISAEQLKSLGVTYCIVGHHERRKLSESINDLKEKISQLLKQGITPIVCVGETIEERAQGLAEKKIIGELKKIIKDFSKKEQEKLIIAYEPIWTIGSNKIISKEDLEKTVKTIKKIMPNNSILYGGGITEYNIILLKNSSLNGYLVGTLSLSIDKVKAFLDTI